MLNPRLNNCVECATISVLLNDINCKLMELSQKQYNNIVFLTNSNISQSLFFNLLTYKRILTYKNINSDYASCYTVDNIASKIKLLIHK